MCAVSVGCAAAGSGDNRLVGDAERGEVIYQKCLGCHSLKYNRTGPRHCGLIGRRAGELPDFEYSDAMRLSRIVWTRETLDAFLAAPIEYVPGTSMGYAGIDKGQDRADLISYIDMAGRSEKVCGSYVK
ncbi:MAG: cytochrome c family protein [Gammaproteobacteria bacterium]|nr:cytochrome c family protein [Gammaproteobacteria bacterium]